MNELLAAIAAERGGYLYRSDVLDCGGHDRDIRAMMRAGILERLRHGTYALTSLLRPLTPEERHLLIAYSVIDKLGLGVALSHHTGCIAHSRTSYGVNLSTIHVTKLDGRHGRNEAGVMHHVGLVVPDSDLCEVGGRLCIRPARAVIESCSMASVESGMVAASFAIRSGSCTRTEILESMAEMRRWPGMARVRLAVARVEPRCESVGEVRSLYMFLCQRIPRPEPQFTIRANGREIARTDFGWIEERHVGEFDGRVKYGRLVPRGADAGTVVFDEKRREDSVRGEQYGMSRWCWADLHPAQRAATGRRILADINRSRGLYGRNAKHIPLSG